MEGLLKIGEAAKALGVSTMTLRRWDKAGNLKPVRISRFRYYRRQDIDRLLDQRTGAVDLAEEARRWVIADHPETPDKEVYCQTSDVFAARLQRFKNDLEQLHGKSGGLYSIIPSIAGEIGNNSFDHNIGHWSDIPGVFFGYDLKRRLVVLADRGQGVFTTLSRVKKLADDKEALRVAFTEVISGRSPEARGNGLKFVRELVVNNNIQLLFQSGDAKLKLGLRDKKLRIRKTSEFVRGCLAVIKYQE